MNSSRLARLALRFLPAAILALLILASSSILAREGTDPGASSGALNVTVSAAYQNYDPEGPIFSNWSPDIAAKDQYAPIKVSFTDPDGIATGTNGPKLWFDGYEATKCYAVGISYSPTSYSTNPNGITWDHKTVTQWGSGCETLATAKLPMADGPHTARVTATDKLGHPNTIEWTFTVDRVLPTVTSSALCGTVDETGTPTIGFAYSDEYGINTSTAIMKVDGAVVAPTVGPADAQYTPAAPLPDGLHVATFEIKDIAGNKGTATCSFRVDTQPPVINSISPADGSFISTASPLITASWTDNGAGADQYSAVLTLDGGDVTAGAAVTQYGLTYHASGLTPGAHTVTVSVKDKTGKTSATGTSTFTYSDDTQAPVIDSLSPADGALIDINNPQIVAAWHDLGSAGIDTATAHLTLDGSDVTSSSTVDQYGATYQAGGLTPGAHTITVNVGDAAGHQSLTISHTFNYTDDTEPPVIDTVSPANAAIIDIGNPLIQVTWHDAGSAGIDETTAHLELDGKDVTASAAVYADGLLYQAKNLELGTHTLSVYVSDNVGHKSATSATTFVYSAINPNGPTFADWKPNPSTKDPMAAISVYFSDPDGIAPSGTLNGPKLWFDGYEATKCYAVGVTTTSNTISWNHRTVTKWGTGCNTEEAQYLPMSDGEHLVKVIATDNLGNKNMKEWTFTIDHTPPTITPSAICGTTIDTANPEISFAYYDQYGIDSSLSRMRMDGAPADVTPGAAETAYSPGPLSEGPHSATMEVYDSAGNGSSSTCTFTVDTQPPAIVLDPADGGFVDSSSPLLSASWSDYGAGVDQYTAQVTFDGVDVTSSAAIKQYGMKYQAGGLSLGDHTLTVSVTDNSGKTATASSKFNFNLDSTPPAIDSLTPANGTVLDVDHTLVSAAWSDYAAGTDYGAGVDQYSAHLELDGTDVTAGATIAEYGLTYEATGLASGAHTVTLYVKDKVGHQSAVASTTFRYSNEITYYAPWYDDKAENGMNGNWIVVSNLEDTSAAVSIYVGPTKVGTYDIGPGGRITPEYRGMMDGSVRVISTEGKELLVSQRVLFKDSFNEVVAVRDSDLDSEYRFTWYDYTPASGMNGNWILVGNPSTSQNAAVDIYIGQQKMGSYLVGPGGTITPSFLNKIDGPVRVICTNGQKIIASQRVIYKNAFSEVMGTPVSTLDDEYFFTWYDSKPENGMKGNWVLIGNENQNSAVDVYVEIGGQRVYNGKVPAGGRVTPQFPGIMNGPVHVGCATCDQYGSTIMASQRVLFKDSFEEVQGTRPADMGDGAVFTWYDLTPPMNGDWILVGNQNAAANAYMQVTIGAGGAPMAMAGGNNTFMAPMGGGNTTPSFPGAMGGPVHVTCADCVPGQQLIISQRVIYKDSFNEVVGRPPRK